MILRLVWLALQPVSSFPRPTFMGTAPLKVDRRPPLSIALQVLALKAAQPGSSCIFTGRSGLIWRGYARPTSASEQYKISIAYTLGHYPKTKVLSPGLKRREGKPIPHMYKQGSLCLFNPNKFEWNPNQRLSDSILPLACLWLYFYEIWLATGEWKGGGDHPSPRENS